jgi:hypothetical protein
MSTTLTVSIYVIIGIVGALAFVLLYALHPMTRKTWWRSPIGQNLLAYSFVMCLIYAQASVNLWFPDWAHKDVSRLVLGLAAIIVVWWRLILLLIEIRRYQRRKNNDRTVLEGNR